MNRLDVPRSLHRCLATRNIVDNPHSGVRDRTRRAAAGGLNGSPLVRGGFLGNREVVPQDYGLSTSMGLEDDSL